MQGTVVMLIALSNLGCHNKCYDSIYTPPSYAYNGCYSGGCYANAQPQFLNSCYVAPACYSSCYASAYNGCYATGQGTGFGGGCYGGGYSSCYAAAYSGHCWGGNRHGCGLFTKLFSCCRPKCLFPDSYYNDFGGPYAYGSPYDPPIFGYALQYNYGMGGAPASGTPMVPATPVTEDATAPPVPSTVAPPAPSTTTPPPPPAPAVAPPVPKPSA